MSIADLARRRTPVPRCRSRRDLIRRRMVGRGQEVKWDEVGSLVDFVFDKNWNRRQLTPSQRAAVAADAKPLYAKEAKDRQVRLAGTRPNTQPDDLVAQTPQGDTG